MVRSTVVGCGIGGACAALALAKIGATVQVHEATPRATEVSGWVTLGPTALTALDQLGLAESVREIGFPVLGVNSVDTVTGRTNSFARIEPGHRWSSTHVWRRDLLSLLRARLDTEGVGCAYGTSVDPGVLEGDLLVGADGARSATRRMPGDLREPAFTGQLIRYGHCPEPVRELPMGVLHFWTHSAGVVGYVGDKRDGSFWFSRRNVNVPTDTVDPDTYTEVLRGTSVAQVPDRSEVGAPIALYELEPEGVRHTTRTVFIGDAAHAVSPAAGRGATSAIEDAITLAKAIRDTDSVAAALERYTATRRPAARAAYRTVPGQRPATITAAALRL
ncbi:FAD-dependent oxidoreductase [Nocardia brevicatena]|uniref:FAD-dependent oxidoreductase n=1 Tax=Nocardia brevicatena TaxID=37327 RepID=UPI00030E3C23|nr:NAD(P)/FAD-dependent oxidoreductase [Nocardia brevicatena]